VLQHTVVVVQAEEQRAYSILTALVPAEPRHHALGGACMLHLRHRALAWLVGTLRRLRNHPVESGTLELLEPPRCHAMVSGHWGEVNRRANARE